MDKPEPIAIIADESTWRKVISQLSDDSLLKLYHCAEMLLHEQVQDDKEAESYSQ